MVRSHIGPEPGSHPQSHGSTAHLIRSLAIVAGALLALVLTAQPAWAHAVLLQSDPADNAQLDQPPDRVLLVFNEPVAIQVGAVRVFDSTGARVDDGDAGHGETPDQVEATLTHLDEGSYVVTWRASSADSHPVRGAFVFRVGETAGPVDESLVAQLLGEDRDAPFAAAGWLLRWATYAGALVAVGGMVFLLVVARQRLDPVFRLVRGAALVAMTGSVLQVPAFAAEATGLGWEALVSGPALADAATSTLGWAVLIRVASLGVIWLAAPRAPTLWALPGIAGVVAADLATGHTRTSEPTWLVMGADAVHVLAAATWVGGLIALALALRIARRHQDAAEGARLVGRFSTLATWTVLALAAGGLALAGIHVRALAALTSTAYGGVLLVKTALVVAVLTVAAYNNRVLVSAVAEEASPAGEGRAWRRLDRTVRVELAGLALVLAATALLVNLQPAAEAAGISGPYDTTVAFEGGQLNLVVDPNRAGENEIHIYLLTPGGLPSLAGGEATLEFHMPEEDIGPIERRPRFAGPGHWLHLGPELAIPGEWVVTFRHRVSEFEEQTVEVAVTVNP